MSVSGSIPNLYLKQNPTTTVSSSIYIRGIGQEESHFTQEPGVGLYIDGVFYSRAPGSITELVDVDRVEVLRGPQGTLFGRSSPAGAISIYTKAPSFDGFSGKLEGSLGNFNERSLKSSANVVLVGGTTRRSFSMTST